MNRNKNEAKKNKGFYIAVCCCVLVMAIVGYVSWFAGNSRPKTQNHTDTSDREVTDMPNLSEFSQAKTNEEEKAPKQATVPVEQKTAPVTKNVVVEDNVPTFSKPVKGDVIGDFSGENLIFYTALSDWRSHDGVDLKAKEGEDVLACADGVVESVYSDSMGNCVLIDHDNGLKTLYANLAESDLDITGQNVKQGDKIGTVGNSALADFSNGAHLHFEVIKDDRPVDPTEYLK